VIEEYRNIEEIFLFTLKEIFCNVQVGEEVVMVHTIVNLEDKGK
jgi:hypothetical protein